MKMFRILGLGSFLCSMALAQPVPSKDGPVADPELDYINTPEAVCAEMGILKKDEIIRRDFDLDGSGNLVTFLAFRGTGSRGGSNWTAYLPRDGKFHRIDNIQFREDFVRAGKVEDLNPSGGLLALYLGKGGGGGLVRYELKDGELHFSELPSLNYDRAKDRELFERIFGRETDERMPEGFYKNPPHQVIRVVDILERSRAAGQK